MGEGEKAPPSGDVIQVTKDIYFGPIHANNVEQLRRLQEAILPVRYKDQFYQNVIEYSEEKLAKIAYFKDVMVGAACCRIEERGDRGKFLYVMTLATLPAYRGRGIGTKLIEYMIERAKELGLTGVFLHVWTSNEDAIRFYSRFGFEIVETLKGYYKRISPPDGHILEKVL